MSTPQQVYERFKSGFSDEFTEEDFANLLWYDYDETNMDYISDFIMEKMPIIGDVAYGATKLVVYLYGESEWVLKFPLRGVATISLHEPDGYSIDKEGDYVMALGECSRDKSYDYCEVEQRIYRALPKSCMNLAAEIITVGTVGCVNAYVSPRVIVESGQRTNVSHDSYERARNTIKKVPCTFPSAYVLGMFYDDYGEDVSDMFFSALDGMGRAEDLHLGNFGRGKDGHIVCIDYAGYNERF